MNNIGDVPNENIKEHNRNWPQIPNHPYRMLIIGGSWSGKTNTLFNLINQQLDIDKIYLYAKDPYEAKYQFLINKRESTGLKHFNESKCLIRNSNNMDDIYKNIQECSPNKKSKILIVLDNMIADILNNKKLNLVVTELYIRDRKLNISLVFIRLPYFAVPKILDQILSTVLLWKFQTNESMNKSHLIIHQILTLKTL